MLQRMTTEERQHAQNLSAKDQGLSGKRTNAFPHSPFRTRDPFIIRPYIRQQNRFACHTNLPDFTNAQRNPAEISIQPRPIFDGGFRWMPRTCH